VLIRTQARDQRTQRGGSEAGKAQRCGLRQESHACTLGMAMARPWRGRNGLGARSPLVARLGMVMAKQGRATAVCRGDGSGDGLLHKRGKRVPRAVARGRLIGGTLATQVEGWFERQHR
jgi:hypothetical protein